MKELNAVYVCTLAGAIIASTVIVQCAETVASPGLLAMSQSSSESASGPSSCQAAERLAMIGDGAKAARNLGNFSGFQV